MDASALLEDCKDAVIILVECVPLINKGSSKQLSERECINSIYKVYKSLSTLTAQSSYRYFPIL